MLFRSVERGSCAGPYMAHRMPASSLKSVASILPVVTGPCGLCKLYATCSPRIVRVDLQHVKRPLAAVLPADAEEHNARTGEIQLCGNTGSGALRRRKSACGSSLSCRCWTQFSILSLDTCRFVLIVVDGLGAPALTADHRLSSAARTCDRPATHGCGNLRGSANSR